MQYVFFCVWLLLLKIISERFNHVNVTVVLSILVLGSIPLYEYIIGIHHLMYVDIVSSWNYYKNRCLRLFFKNKCAWYF